MTITREGRLHAARRLARVALALSALCAATLATRSAAAPAGGGGTAGIARIAVVQNQVESRRSEATAWKGATVDEALFARDRVRTGPASRAALLYSDQTLHRLNERSEIEVLPASGSNPGVLRVISGQHYFSSRTPKDYGQIETPTVTAAIKGTEFVVDVAEGGATTISMLEGVVEATNRFGSLTVTRGEAAYAEPGRAPVKRILVRPRDAVTWALYYPRVLGGSDAERLRSAGVGGEALARASDLLSAGQVEAARPLIERARAERPDDPIALALASVIETASNRREEASRLAAQAVERDPRSASAALALSFASQASFDIAKARAAAETAARLDPESAEALARVAELRMAEGDLDGAREAAEGAVRRRPGEARALTVLGFVDLAQFRTADGRARFEAAVAADPAFALGRLGLGIALIRSGRLAGGREEIQTAVLLDPDDALLRSYLAKAYYEEKRPVEAGKELAASKELDPSDPTPYLYDAIRKQNENRPVEALYDLQKSIELNDRRAVYRSRLLLDQDRAVRGADLARIYNDLGFEQLGLVTARRSADEDQSNYSSHLFLAGNYRTLPGFASAFRSEVLQGRIYQPTSVNAARPDVVNETVSFNEYTALFDRPRLRAFGSASYGRTDEDLSELFGGRSSPFLSLVEVDGRSEFGAGSILGTANGDRYAAALGYTKFSDDGFRVNADNAVASYRGFLEVSPTWRDTVQINALYGRGNRGDGPFRNFAAVPSPERFRTDLRNVGLGYRRVLSPAADFAVSAIYNRSEQTAISLSPFSAGGKGIFEGPQLELQYVRRAPRVSWVFGAGAFRGEVKLESAAGGSGLRSDDEFSNGYAYAKIRALGPLEVTAGASVERVVSPNGLLTPRDAQIGAAEIDYTATRVSPKLGATLVLGGTTLRAAGLYRLNPAIGRLQTLEPTQVAGFNQFFDDPGGTRSLSYGAGLDQDLGRHVFAGLSVQRRELRVPEAACDAPSAFARCTGQIASHIERRDSRELLGSGYVNAAVGTRLALSLQYGYERRRFDTTVFDNQASLEDFVRTRRVRPEARYFFPFGLFAGAAATLYDQRIERNAPPLEERFWIGDVEIGYRLPRRLGSVLLEARNVTDREFEFYERAVEETVIPARQVTLTGSFTF